MWRAVMSEFEKWFLSNGIPLDTDFNVAKRAFEAGQQSQQAKIDELQARIDATEAWIEANKKTIALSEWHGYTTEEYVDVDDLLDTLKGNKDEN